MVSDWRSTFDEAPDWSDHVARIELKSADESIIVGVGGFLDMVFDGECEHPVLCDVTDEAGNALSIHNFSYWRTVEN